MKPMWMKSPKHAWWWCIVLLHLDYYGIFHSISNLAGDVLTISDDVSVTLAPPPQ
ncbi:hypothetical protein ARMGADRAFT_1017596 [Armillaria gallica]|uniref:Uncharacterized protein n=1 Tax=Armillaria gallica TaxID=47427 RepID=A0A2H3D455_ARMGA|nr:hypothetical protein ARMGADRAFT_1017596 [Armillaria gallica]